MAQDQAGATAVAGADEVSRRITELVAPKKVIGTRTEECIRSGVVLGAADAVDGLVRRIKGEWPTSRVPIVIATGGLAEVVAQETDVIQIIAPWLTLDGLRILWDLNHPL